MLQFPNARLYIYNLLADKSMTGAEAIARGAHEFGVLDRDVNILSEIKDCDCCSAAHCVLRSYFQSKKGEFDDSTVDKVWDSLLVRLSLYRARDERVEGPAPLPNCENACSNLAPIIFDLILQEIRRYE
ncbi:MAG: hypothetical protein IT343_12160 [Candidatus Melainabacteria bacterium]|jgi:hypothetical protein|nr:hypothetical protein [Candidatus Melainabacteria bacterium]